VATAYYELLELDEELLIAQEATKSYGESLRLFSQRLQGGIASRLETSSAEAAMATSAAKVAGLERQIVLKENQLGALLGHIIAGHLEPHPAEEVETRSYQPMNVNFGLFPPLTGSARAENGRRLRGTEKSLAKKRALTRRALNDLQEWLGVRAAAELQYLKPSS
jgi:folate-dependent tRNA-U54 methylase TrmFO/GidA